MTEPSTGQNLPSIFKPFRDIVAVVTAYNEGDVIASCLKHLTNQGIGVYVIDNWSTDNTEQEAKQFLKKGLLGLEKFPASAPSPHFSLEKLLKRVEVVHQKLGARWCIHQDADEIRSSPWPNISLPEALQTVEAQGFNTVNHFCLVFRPTDNDFSPSSDMGEHFKYYELGERPGHYIQLKMWKNPGSQVNLHASGGHRVSFPNQRIYPTPFLLKHYPIRSQQHGLRKILLERKNRFDPHERAKGWHHQYDQINQDTNFVFSPEKLEVFDEIDSKTMFLQNPPQPPLLSR